MEIISYIDEQPVKNRTSYFKNTKGSLALKESSFDSSAKEVAYSTIELNNFGAGKVTRDFSLKTFFLSTRQKINGVEAFIGANLKNILIYTGVVVASLGLLFAGVSLISYFKNHTSPLKLENFDSTEVDTLNAIMQKIYVDQTEYDEQGNVQGLVAGKIFSEPVEYQTYKVKAGDTISGIAKRFGLSNISTLISVNNIDNVRYLFEGQKIRIPSIDGIIYKVQKGDTLNSVVEKNKIKMEDLLDVNELSSEVLSLGQELFLPGVGLDQATLRNAMGEIFRLPIHARFRWTSSYGNRIDPIKGTKAFHTGTDLACPKGTPIYPSMSGTVSYTGSSSVFGNYVIINHGNGYQTLYAHMSKILTSKGRYVSQNTKIGLVGSTGYSTGNHLHFTVYKNGKTIDPKKVLRY